MDVSDWLADLIEGAAEVATVNPLAERLKQGAGKTCDASISG